MSLFDRLVNGTIVKEGDRVKYINSDGILCIGRICIDPYNEARLYFWNRFFNIQDYQTAIKI